MSTESEYQLSIGQFSIITRLSKKALRLYDQKGLLVPSRDPLNNYRFYQADQIDIGLKIKYFTWMGFSLKEVQEILSKMNDPDQNLDQFESLFKKRLAETQMEIQRLKKVEEILHGKSIIDVLYVKTTLPTIKSVPEIRVVSYRARGPVGNFVGEMMGKVMGQIYRPDNQRGQITIKGSPILLYVDHDLGKNIDEQDFNLLDLDMEIAIPISGKINIDNDFEVKNLPACKVISVTHSGPYDEIEGAYVKIYNYLKKKAYKVKGVFREIYLNDPNQVSKEQILTEVQLPIELL
jgi:effector-binding domain-containing protein